MLIYDDECDLLPVPVLSNTLPANTPHFLTHIILSLGCYKTEIDALCHPNFRACLHAVNLIGISEDELSLNKYAEELTLKYIEEQLVFFPNSLDKSETYIVMSKGIFDDAIIHNTISINELPPHTISSLRASKTNENTQFWASIIISQKHAIYNFLHQLSGIPSSDDLANVSRENKFDWNPIQAIFRNNNQSQQSFEEQQKALELNMRQINKYKATNGH